MKILLVRSGAKPYTAEHVLALRRQIERLPSFHNITTLTDQNDTPGTKEVRMHKWPGGWSKMELFAPVIHRYIQALARALPERSHEELVLGFQFVIGVMIHVISGHVRTDPDTQPPELPDERILQQMVAFASAGIRARNPATDSKRAPGASR